MDHETTTFLASRGENLLYEEYFNGADRETTQTSFSVAKSFTSTLVDPAIEDGLLELDDSITIHIPELIETDQRYSQITIRNLITMSSGLR